MLKKPHSTPSFPVWRWVLFCGLTLFLPCSYCILFFAKYWSKGSEVLILFRFQSRCLSIIVKLSFSASFIFTCCQNDRASAERWATLLCCAKTPYEPSDDANFPSIKIEFYFSMNVLLNFIYNSSSVSLILKWIHWYVQSASISRN